jgi:hypothetical protein
MAIPGPVHPFFPPKKGGVEQSNAEVSLAVILRAPDKVTTRTGTRID